MKTLQEELMEYFLDYFNNYLSVERFAEDYGLHCSTAALLIEAGRDAHEHNVREQKQIRGELK